MSVEVIQVFLEELHQCTRHPAKTQLEELQSLLSINPSVNKYIVRINNLDFLEEKTIARLVESVHFYNDEWLAFGELVVSFIRMCNQLNPWSLLESFELYSIYMKDISVAFNNVNRGYLVSHLAKETVGYILPIAKDLDCLLYFRENSGRPRLKSLAAILFKMFNNIRSQLSGDPAENLKMSAKSGLIFYLGVKLCQTYFKLSNPLLCRNVFSNMNNASLSIKNCSLNEQLQYRYYLGKFYFIQDQLIDASQHLLWCLFHCPPLKNHPNINEILKFLLPISIVIGKKPNFDYIENIFYSDKSSVPSFFAIYRDICGAICAGNYNHFCSIIRTPQNYEFLKESNLLMLITKSVLLILRNLIRRVWKMSSYPTKLEYGTIHRCLSLSVASQFEPSICNLIFNTEDDLMVENVLITLIDQNMLKGKLFPRLRVISLAKTNVFPRVDRINFIRFGRGDESLLNDDDKWLNE